MLDVPEAVCAVVNERLTLETFARLAGTLTGIPFVKIVVDRPNNEIRFIKNARHKFHADYIAEEILKVDLEQFLNDIDEFNRSVYVDPSRRFYLGILGLHQKGTKKFFTFETVEVDAMNAEMLKFFFHFVKDRVDPSIPLLFKPANHLQEAFIAEIDSSEIPRIYNYELFASSDYIALNKGKSEGRLRVFKTEQEYRKQIHAIEWYDIIVMERVPDDIHRVSGIINARHTTPLSHTNVLASGWKIPNAIQIGIMERIEREQLDGHWVRYQVEPNAGKIRLEKIDKPAAIQ